MSKLVIPGVIAQSGNGGGGGGGDVPQNTNPLERITCEEDNVTYATITIDEKEIELEAPYFDSLSEAPTTPLHFIGVLPSEYAESGTTWEYEIVQYKANEAWYHLIGTDMVFCIQRDAETEDILMVDIVYPLEAMLPDFHQGSSGNKQLIQRDNSDGAIKWVTDNKLENTATDTNSLTILGTATTQINAVNVGQSSRAVGASSVAVGYNAMAGMNSIAIGSGVASGTNNHKNCIAINGSAGYGDYSIAIGGGSYSQKNVVLGHSASAYKVGSIAIGYGAVIGDFVTPNTGEHSIQIGKGTTLEPYTLNIGFDGTNYKLLDGTTGKIPAERLPSSGGSVPTYTWYKGNTGTTITIVDTTNANLVLVYKNGLLLEPSVDDSDASDAEINDYSVSGTTLTLTQALVATDKITVAIF